MLSCGVDSREGRFDVIESCFAESRLIFNVGSRSSREVMPRTCLVDFSMTRASAKCSILVQGMDRCTDDP